MPAPQPRQIDSWRAAEENAAEWMRHWGWADAMVTPGGPDAGIDVYASAALAQVKWEAAQTGTPALQRLVGARRNDHHKALLFFSGAGFSAPAIEYADDMDVALFKYALDGRVSPLSLAAHRISLRQKATPETEPQSTSERAGARLAEPAREKLPGRGWFGRNWTAVLGAFFLLQALVNGMTVVRREGASTGIDWYDPLISLIVGLAFSAVWSRSSTKRRRWKVLREAGRAEASATEDATTNPTPRPAVGALEPFGSMLVRTAPSATMVDHIRGTSSLSCCQVSC